MKILITSDVHLHKYRNYNLFDDPEFRLKQYNKLCKRLIQIIREQDCEAVFIAGDFFHVANPLPETQNAGFEFLGELANEVPVYITQGQHDSDSRTLMSESNTILKICSMIPNLHYMHKKELILDGTKFWFQGWTPEQDFTQIKHGEYDVLIGHATISNSHINQYDQIIEHGQEIESDKFKWCIFGDIHYHQIVGNQVAIGVPIQSNFNDHPDVGVLIFDTSDNNWYRVPTITEEFKFLRFIITDEESNDPYVITKSPVKHQIQHKQTLHKSINVLELVDKLVAQHNLSTIHNEILNSSTKDSTQDLSLMFKIEEISASNFRSIDSITYNPINGVKVVRGPNGSGKSTLFEVLAYNLKNRGDARALVRNGQSAMHTSVTIQYSGLRYTINRGWDGGGYLQLLINDVAVESENKRATEQKLIECLPFLERYDLIYHDQDRPKFLTNYNYSARVDLINRALDLNVVDSYKQIADTKIGIISTNIRENTHLKQNHEAVLTATDGMEFTDLNTDYTSELTQLDQRLKIIAGIKSTVTKIKTSEGLITAANSALETYKSKDFSGISEDYSSKIDVTKSNLDKFNLRKVELDTEISQLNSSSRSLSAEIATIESKIQTTTLHLNSTTAETCYACGHELNAEKVKVTHEELTRNLEALSTTLNESKSKLIDVDEKLSKVKTQKDMLDKGISEFEKVISSLESKQATIKSLKDDYDRKIILESDLESNSKTLDQLKIMIHSQLNATGFSQLVELPTEDISEGLTAEELKLTESRGELTNKIKLQEYNKKLYTNLLTAKSEIVKYEEIISNLEAELELYNKYSQLMSPKGEIVLSVLNTVSEQLSDERIQVVVHKTLASGETRPDFNLALKVDDHWIPYDNLSGGQKVLCDIFIIRHLINMSGGIGMLIFDESLKELDADNLEYAVEYLKQIETNDMFIISHVDNFPYFDSSLIVQKVGGRTEYTTL